ncbi:C40 family peptidase [Streptacidiphilus fuscans]|uniref:C40 family peptidase n=1 Tax=Streptacidiphilus fuscans TaxID=2789292 RepID=A0A931B773_9ACTN|nr:C40 family peptidase [Streptacidiphilus fuscans]MBF9071411.1 C40 family peptidase [Streptacidiphilus fuscans]
MSTAFAELDTTGCTCVHCRAHSARTAPAAPKPPATPHMGPLARAAATTAMLAVGGGAALISAPAAHAEPAPAHAGWDGSRYWFRANGEWRWTSHYDIYLRHSSGGGSGSGTAATGGGIRQGWDGHRYWFRKNGEWRWTTHYAIYLAHIGTGHPSPSPTPTPTPNPSPAPAPGPSVGNLEAAIGYAEAQLGKPYVWGGNGPYGFDCSGLVQQAYRRAGISLPRVAADQYRATSPITASQLRRGDLVFWSSSSRASGIHHVAIYLGGGRYIEAPHPGADVRISVLSTGYYPTQFGRVS